MKRVVISIVGSLGLLLFLLWLNVNTGSVDLRISEIYQIIIHKTGDATAYRIVWDIRLPRILAAMILGGALSVSGFLLQTFFRNPIAGPFVLGISSGAKLLVAVSMILMLQKGRHMSSWGLIFVAFLGSLMTMGFVLLLSLKTTHMSVLVVCGIMVGYICTAITDFMVTFADDSNIVNLHNWSQGSFAGMTWDNVKVMAILVAITVLFSFFMAKPIGAYHLGENYARNMGVSIKVLRVALILLSSVLSGCVTAFAGPISFVGIAVPHLMKMAMKSAKPIFLIPGCFLGGAVVTLFSDFVARTVFAPVELSISTVTAIFLVPVVIYMMLVTRRSFE